MKYSKIALWPTKIFQMPPPDVCYCLSPPHPDIFVANDVVSCVPVPAGMCLSNPLRGERLAGHVVAMLFHMPGMPQPAVCEEGGLSPNLDCLSSGVREDCGI